VADRLHLVAPAGECRPFFDKLDCKSPEAFVALVQQAIGDGFTVTADSVLLAAREDEARGGRTDDARRAADIEAALADDDVVALVAIRGGAWLSRILPRIDFSVLDRRSRRVAAWGFSELTTLVNIVGSHPNGLGVYDMGPAFLAYGLKHHATARREAMGIDDPARWALERLRPELIAFFRSVGAMLRGAGDPVRLHARIERGDATQGDDLVFVGGNVTVLATLIGTPYESSICPDGKWLVLEDYNDKPERFDRFFAHFTLAGYFEACAGVLLGDFHKGDRDLLASVLAILDHHLPADRAVPVLSCRQIGHTWPMTPLPLYRGANVAAIEKDGVELVFPPRTFGMIDAV